MSNGGLPKIVQPYKEHPLVKKVDSGDLNKLDNEPLNKIIRSVDLILRGLRENYLKGQTTPTRLNAGSFSSSVLISRGWLFLDSAHATRDVDTIVERIYANTRTTTKRSVIKNINDSIIPRLQKNNLMVLGASGKTVVNVMPYPISSKLFVQKELLENPYLLSQQINQFGILGKVQDFPELTGSLSATPLNPETFVRDYRALTEIDVIRERSIKGRNFTLAKAYLLDDKKSYDLWATVLDTTDNVRKGLKGLMELQGQLGGFVSQSEIIRMTNWNPRMVNRLIRRVDTLGLAQRSHTLDFEDALNRPTETKVALNYHKLKDAEMMLTLCRSVPESVDILEKLRTERIIDEDSLISEFDPISVGKVRHALSQIEVIMEQKLSDDIWEIAPNKEGEDFLLEITTIMAKSRRILGENIEVNKKLEDFFKDVDDTRLEKTTKQVEKDFLNEMGQIV